jgi:acetyl esterase/lipase
VLLDDSRRYVERVVATGVDARLDLWMRMPHGFVTNIGGFNAAGQAIKATGAFLAGLFPKAPIEGRCRRDRRRWS